MANRSGFSSNWQARSDVSSSQVNRNIGHSSHDNYNSKRRTMNPQKASASTLMTEAQNNELRGEDDPRTLQAIEEGSVGNLPYMAKRDDVESVFVRNGFQIEHINMSTDPYTGRNPSYCFVELPNREDADRANRELNGQYVLGRPVKIGSSVSRSRQRPQGEYPGHQSSRRERFEQPVFQRWTRTDAPNHWEGYTDQGRRVFVGGLPRMEEHAAVNEGIRELFQGFQIEAVSKVIIPKNPSFGHPKAWNRRYLFVDFSTSEEARRAVRATDGKYAWGAQIRVQLAKDADSRKALERRTWDAEHSVLQSS